MELILEKAITSPEVRNRFEIVERKGLGHPDTVCDALAEALSVNLCQYYLSRFGLILHHNVDKALLCGGMAKPAFGGGEIVEPIEIILAGRATRRFNGVDIPIEEIARDCVHTWFRSHFHMLDPERHVTIHCKIRPGSKELVALFARQQENGVLLSNDTSCGVGFAPYTPLESMVLATENYLNDPAIKQNHPEIGEDIKVMGILRDNRIRITLACAMIDRYIADVADYQQKILGVATLARAALARTGTVKFNIDINTGDDPAKGAMYLTVTGTSGESGDDGEVGRGNRASGLITPFRPMTMEATAGKNPVSHVGKLYNIAAQRIAAALVDSGEGIAGAECCLVSQIGRPVDDPASAFLRLEPDAGRELASVAVAARQIVQDEIAHIPTLWQEVINGTIRLF